MRSSIADLERMTGFTYRTIKKRLVKQEPQEEGSCLYYETPGALAAIYADDDASRLDLAKERALLARMQTRKLELEILKIEGDLVEIDILQDVFDQCLLSFKERMMRIPGSLAPYWSQTSPRPSEEEMHQLMSGQIRVALEEVKAIGQKIVKQKIAEAI
jgi:hypothetical protein